jgi:uncharacterized protein (TIGR02145 family)
MKTTKIGDVIWMAQNLNVDSFRNSELIPEAKTWEEWFNAVQNKLPSWCYYENDAIKGENYGKLYNWYAVNDKRGLAPEGWHIPSETEFEVLRLAVNYDGNLLKRIGQGKGGGAGKSVTGFGAKLGGCRDGGAHFHAIGEKAFFWSSTKTLNGICYLHLAGDHGGIGIGHEVEYYGFSVRCIEGL